MKAKLSLENIGGLRGSHFFDLQSGKLNYLEGPNSGGKTSVVKALTAVLSIPNNGDLGRFIQDEATKLGIRTEKNSPQEGFVNVHADKALVDMNINGESSRYEVRQNGDYIEFPEKGDQRFLLAGILSNESKILRQLRGVDEHEPDDFRWAVSELSYATKYDEVNLLLKSNRDAFSSLKLTVEKSIRRRDELQLEKDKLLKQKTVVDNELKEIGSKHETIKAQLEERDKLRRETAGWTETIGNIKGSLSKIQSQLRSFQEGIEQYALEITEKEDELKRINVAGQKAQKEEREAEIEKEVNGLIDERNSLNGLYNLLVTAQAAMRKETQSTKCPLCESGKITYRAIVSRVEDLRQQRDALNDKISTVNLEKEKLGKQLDAQIKKIEDLKEELGTIHDAKRKIETEYQRDKSAITGDEDKIHDYEQRILKAEKATRAILEKLGPEHEKIQEVYAKRDTEYRKLSERIAVVNQQIEETSVDIDGHVIEPKVAERTLKNLMGYLEELITFAEQRAEEQRQKAAVEFNTNIKKLIESLGFKEFRTIRLDNAYRLYVERLDPKTSNYVFQPVNTLSESEKLSIALILQVALKETYMPDIPFFIIDGVIQDFDEDRRVKVLDYLSNKAEERDWFVVVTRLTEDAAQVRVRLDGR